LRSTTHARRTQLTWAPWRLSQRRRPLNLNLT
jgi:hypothetical protein